VVLGQPIQGGVPEAVQLALAEAERMLVDARLRVRPSVYKVEAITKGESLTLLDVLQGGREEEAQFLAHLADDALAERLLGVLVASDEAVAPPVAVPSPKPQRALLSFLADKRQGTKRFTHRHMVPARIPRGSPAARPQMGP